MDMTVLYFPQGNDIQVTAQFPTISDGTGATAYFYYKGSRYVADDDPTTQVYTSDIVPDPNNVGATMSTFLIPSADNATNGAFWWRVDAEDTVGTVRTANCGPLLVEAVLWEMAAQCRSSFCVTGLQAQEEIPSTGELMVTSIGAEMR
jgi:hypothetical protein